MTPKDKAEELITKFIPHVRWKMGQENVRHIAKECAHITVDEILADIDDPEICSQNQLAIDYWRAVKRKIDKL